MDASIVDNKTFIFKYIYEIFFDQVWTI
jgi:hypothetical protein